MANGSDGRFSTDEIQTIWEAHREWCAERAIKPDSTDGEEAAAAMLSMYKSGKIRKHELVAWHA
ncbi:hypothetical protein [Rhizobium halophilum]|uniref:hypothetical protein n=1 Tax=Rhizobium halophilum TaxID=2846852 RepID=UPI001EFDA6B0|nr:hypothetical protein [Rhizobium halophilum]MCF6371324.1 hypothetical protein [Rhizobium halophilum]